MWNISCKWVNITVINHHYLCFGVLLQLNFLLTIQNSFLLFFRYVKISPSKITSKSFHQFNIIFSSFFCSNFLAFGMHVILIPLKNRGILTLKNSNHWRENFFHRRWGNSLWGDSGNGNIRHFRPKLVNWNESVHQSIGH